MHESPFPYTTSQAARLLGAQPSAMRVAFHRAGHYRGVKPAKLANSRLLWPRAGVLALAGKLRQPDRVEIDVRTTMPWLETLGLPTADPMAVAVAIALNDPRNDPDRDPQTYLDEWHAVRSWTESARRRLFAARPSLSPEQWAGAQTLAARAIALLVASLDPDTLQRAVADVAGGAA